MVSPFRNTLWISPASDFAFVRQTLRVSVSTPVKVPMNVFPCVVKTLTCFWRRFDSSSMNFRPAVEDSYPGTLEACGPGDRYITFGSDAVVLGIFNLATIALASLASLAEARIGRSTISNRREHLEQVLL